MSAFTIFNNNVNAPAVSVHYYNEDNSSVTANVIQNERRDTLGIRLNSTVTVRWQNKDGQTIVHNQVNQRVLEITHGVGNLLGLNWLPA